MRALFLNIMILTIFLFFCGCTEIQIPLSENNISREITIQDNDGNTISFTSEPERIVVIGDSIAKAIALIGAEKKVVGVSDSILKNKELNLVYKNTSSIGETYTPNCEKILALNADLVLAFSSAKPKNVETLKSIGIPIVFLDCYKVHTLSRDIRILGNITGNQQNAENLSLCIDSVYYLVLDRIATIPSEQIPTVYYELGDFTAGGTNSAGDILIHRAGGKNCINHSPIMWIKVNQEWIVNQNPNFIIKEGSVNTGHGDLSVILKNITERPGMNEVDAVKKNHTYVLSSRVLSGPPSIIGLVYIAKILHPEEFADINPETFEETFFISVPSGELFIYPPV